MYLFNNIALIRGKVTVVDVRSIKVKSGHNMPVYRITVEASKFESTGTATKLLFTGNWYLTAFGNNCKNIHEGKEMVFFCELRDKLITSKKAVLRSDTEKEFQYHSLDMVVLAHGKEIKDLFPIIKQHLESKEVASKNVEDITLDDIFEKVEHCEKELTEEEFQLKKGLSKEDTKEKKQAKNTPKKAPVKPAKPVKKVVEEVEEDYEEGDDSDDFDE